MLLNKECCSGRDRTSRSITCGGQGGSSVECQLCYLPLASFLYLARVMICYFRPPPLALTMMEVVVAGHLSRVGRCILTVIDISYCQMVCFWWTLSNEYRCWNAGLPNYFFTHSNCQLIAVVLSYTYYMSFTCKRPSFVDFSQVCLQEGISWVVSRLSVHAPPPSSAKARLSLDRRLLFRFAFALPWKHRAR